MIEEHARVVAIADGEVWVETQRQTACGACMANKGCGTAVLSKVLGKRQARVRAHSQLPLAVGDEVIIGIEENALLKGSLAVYMLPLMGMFLGTLLGQGLDASEHVAVVSGMLGLLLGFAGLRVFSRQVQTDVRFQPVVVRISRAANPLA